MRLHQRTTARFVLAGLAACEPAPAADPRPGEPAPTTKPVAKATPPEPDVPPPVSPREATPAVKAEAGTGASGIVAAVEHARAQSAAAAAPLHWTDVHDRPALLEALRRADDEGRGVFVDVTAQWCLPCRELAEGPLADPDVVAVLAKHFVAIRLDVTDGTDEQADLQARLEAEALPTVVVWGPDAGVAGALQARKPLASPVARLKGMVEASDIVAALEAASRPENPD